MGLKDCCWIFLVGSAAEFGVVEPEDSPIGEHHPLRPVSVYGLTKALQTQLMDFYVRSRAVDTLMVRPFNLRRPGVSTRLFVGRLCDQIDRYKLGKIDRIVLGNLEHSLDYIEVEKAVEFYTLIMRRGLPGAVYNVGSGVSTRIKDLLQRMLRDNNLNLSIVETHTYSHDAAWDVKDVYADVSSLHVLSQDGGRMVD